MERESDHALGSADQSEVWTRVSAYGNRFGAGPHLVIVDHVGTGEPRALDISGETVTALLTRRREKHYFEVPVPTATYDSLVGEVRKEAH